MDARDALLRLAAELKRHDWPARINERGDQLALTVTNPDKPDCRQSVVCATNGDGELIYRIRDGKDLGRVDDVARVEDQLRDRLRGGRKGRV